MEQSLVESTGITEFKTGVNELLQKRDYFIKTILPRFTENRDYYTIKGRKSLGKSGAEKLATIYSLVATFTKDTATLNSFGNTEGLVAYICNLSNRSGEVVGQGRGAALLKNNQEDVNKTIKMAEKSAFISAVIRFAGLSDLFTSDLEDMPLASIQEVKAPDNYFPKNQTAAEDEPITTKQKDLLRNLIVERVAYGKERERWFQEMETCSKFDASEMISSFLITASRGK